MISGCCFSLRFLICPFSQPSPPLSFPLLLQAPAKPPNLSLCNVPGSSYVVYVRFSLSNLFSGHQSSLSDVLLPFILCVPHTLPSHCQIILKHFFHCNILPQFFHSSSLSTHHASNSPDSVVSTSVKVCSYLAQYPILMIAQSDLHFISLADLFNQTPSQRLWEASSHMLQLMHEDCSYTYPPHVYSQVLIYTAE